MSTSILKPLADVATASDLSVEARFLMFKAALTVGDAARVEAARLDAEAAFTARLDAYQALYGAARRVDGRG